MENEVALVTGAGQGIGRAIALRLSNEGARVAIIDLKEEKMQAVADITPEEIDKIMKVNVQGVLWGIQAAAKKFKRRGHKGKLISALYQR